MSKAMVVLGKAETVQGDVLKEGHYVRDFKGMGISTFTLESTSTHSGMETNSKVLKACICVSLMS